MGKASATGRGGPHPGPAHRLGTEIRAARHAKGLTLVQLAGRTALSHSFLSQVERGLAQPSMASLFRIADALGTTQDRLLATTARPGEQVALLRGTEGLELPATGAGTGAARQLLAEPGRFYPTEFVDLGPRFEDFFQHPGNEFIYVAEGVIEVELGDFGDSDGATHVLGAGDCLRYPGTVPHRWRAAEPGRTRALMVHTDVSAHPLLDQERPT